MNRKVNLAKLAKKGVEQAVKHGLTPATQAIQAKEIKTESPYFSPVSHRTRNKQLQKLPNTNEHVDVEHSKSTVEIEKKVLHRKHIKLEYDKIDEASTSKSSERSAPYAETSNGNKPRKRASDNAKALKVEPDLDEAAKQKKWEPKNWQQMFDNIKTMRADRSAPVDTMGCDKCSDVSSPENIQRYHHLIALMLSSQTKDAVTYDAMGRLKEHGLTPQKMIEIENTDLEKLLHPVSFYKTKAKHIKQTARILVDTYDSDIPKTITELVKLPGVGPKMAHILMRVAWGIMTGIGVDTHVHRIANRLKWMKKETKTPEETRIALESWLPLELWWEVNELLVGFGQNTCKPVHPLCSECLNYDICPSRQSKR